MERIHPKLLLGDTGICKDDVWTFGELVERVLVSGDAVKVVFSEENGRESA